MRAAHGILLAALAGSACRPNRRNEIAGVVQAAMAQAVSDAPGKRLCVERAIASWQPAAAARRLDPPAPPGFAPLLNAPEFRGGGGLKGGEVAGVRIGAGNGCFQLRGPLIAGDHAMLEVHLPGIGWNVWARRTDGDWRVVMTTTSVYPREG